LADLAYAYCNSRRYSDYPWVGISKLAVHRHREETAPLVQLLNDLQVSVVGGRFGVGGVPSGYFNLRLAALRLDNSFIYGTDEHGALTASF